MTAALGPAVVAVPVDWAADAVAGAARGWFRRFRRTDDLSRLVTAAVGPSAGLSDLEFKSVRALLEDPGTWRVLGGGSVEDLATRIASCLPPGVGRTTENSRVAGLAIARGLLEFAVWDLEPEVFQRVLRARLERMETEQATMLDQALFGLHADLAAGFAEVREQFGRVLDSLPPGPAGRDEIAVYLTALISWLNIDPWPEHRQFSGPVLTPAAIERKLQVRAADQVDEQALDADELVGRCRRLVILGGPGSGKTWLARRSARRCAEKALRAIQAGGTLEEVELPLFTTCSALLGADGDIRQAAVSSALNHLGDLGGSRISGALRVLFTERSAAMVLVLDSLDEAEGSGKRIRQADTLPWRIVLTSRPSSWNGQLAIDPESDVHRVGELQPLRYPDDVEPFIYQWFNQEPARGSDLAEQIARRPDLQKAATVPLILAFYCIIGAGQPLPQFRRDLYAMVLRRMLTGRWRGDEVSRSDPDRCLGMLRDWAWSGSASDPVSGVGRWTDSFPAAGRPLGGEADSALDHIAMPLGPPDIDTDHTERHFIHRTVREHLVAKHVASLPLDQAAEALLPHLWYDQDWEYAAPAALVMHNQPNELLLRLICKAARSDSVPEDLSVIDAGWEFRGFLARVAVESSQADWSPEIARTIGQARVELARTGRTADLSGAHSWQTSNRQVREVLIGLLATRDDPRMVRELAEVVAGLDPTPQERTQVRAVLLGLLPAQDDPWTTRELAEVGARLAMTAQERAQVREALLGLLPAREYPWMARELAGTVTRLAETPQERAQVRAALLGLLATQNYPEAARDLVGAVARLAEAPQERAQARGALLGLLPAQDDPRIARELAEVVAGLDPTPRERAQVRAALLGLLPVQDDPEVARELAEVVAGLGRTAQERAQVRTALLGLLPAQDDPRIARELAAAVAGLDPTPQERAQVRAALLGLLAAQDDPEVAHEVAGEVAGLGGPPQERAQVRAALLGLLPVQDDPGMAGALAGAVAGLAEAPQERAQVRAALLGLLPAQDDPWTARELAEVVAWLDPTPQERAQVRETLLGLLPAQDDPWMAGALAELVAGLGGPAQERAQVRAALLGLLPAQDDPWMARELAGVVAGLAETPQERAQVREALLGPLATWDDPRIAREVADVVVGLDPTPQERAQVRAALLGLLPTQDDPGMARELAEVVAGLDPTPQERAQVREALLGPLATWDDPRMARELAEVVAGLDPAPQERAQVREALLGPLATGGDPWIVRKLAEVVAKLAPTPQERAQVRAVLLGLLPAQDDPWMVRELVGAVAGQAETSQERAQARAALLGLLSAQDDPWVVRELAGTVAGLDPTPHERAQVREALLGPLATQDDPEVACELAEALVELAETVQERAQVREALLGLLATQDDPEMARELAEVVAGLDPTPQERAQVREALLGLLATQDDPEMARELAGRITGVRPMARDLSNWHTWPFPPTVELLAAARQNSPLADWLGVLPSLNALSS